MIPLLVRPRSGIQLLSLACCVLGCSTTAPIDMSKPESVAVGFERRKAANDAVGAVELLSPASRKLLQYIGGPGHAEWLMRWEHNTLRNHGGLKSIEVTEVRRFSEDKCFVTYEMIAKDGTKAGGTQRMIRIDGRWYLGMVLESEL